MSYLPVGIGKVAIDHSCVQNIEYSFSLSSDCAYAVEAAIETDVDFRVYFGRRLLLD